MKKIFTRLFTNGGVNAMALTLFMLLSSMQISFAQTCSAQFTWKPGTTANSIGFTSSPNPTGTHFTWYFGDNTKSDNPNPFHTYNAAGSYKVCLSVTDTINGVVCHDEWCDTVKVGTSNVICDPHFTYRNDPSGAVIFTGATNPSNTIYEWNWGDGHSGTGNPADHRYAVNGTYWVCLKVSIVGTNGYVYCINTWCDSVKVGTNSTPTCSAKFTHHAGNTLNSEIFTSSPNPPGTQYLWTFGDGKTSSYPNPDHIYPSGGNWVACLTVKVLSSSGAILCTDQYCDTVKIGTPPPPPTCDAHFTWKEDSVTHTIYFNGAPNAPGAVYAWKFGDGYSGTGVHPDHHYANPGKYLVCLVVEVPGTSTTNSCRASWCDTIVVGGTPPPPPSCSAKFTYKVDTTHCTVIFYAGTNTFNGTFIWNFGDGTSGKGNPADHHYMKPGKYNVCLTTYIIGTNGAILCKDRWCDSIEVHCTPPPPPVTCSAKFTFTVDSTTKTVNFTSDPNNPTGTVYHWTFGDGTSSNDPNPHHTYTTAGVFYVCLVVEVPSSSNTSACRNQMCVKIAVGSPTPTLDSCNAKFRYYFDWTHPYDVKFQPSPNPAGSYFTWTFGDGDTSHLVDPTHTFPDTGLYEICLTVTSIRANAQPCTSKYCRKIYINGPIIHPTPGGDQIILYPNPSMGNSQIDIADVDQPVMIQFYNTKGEMILRKENLVNGSYPLDTRNMDPGLYYYRVTSGDTVIGTGKLVVQ